RSGSAFDIEIKSHWCAGVDTVFIEHRLIRSLQTRNGCTALCELSARSAAKRNDHIAAGRAHALHQRKDGGPIRQRIVRDRCTDAAPGGRASAITDYEAHGKDLDSGLLLNRCELPISSKAHVDIRREHFPGWWWRRRTAQRRHIYGCALCGTSRGVVG